MIIRYCIFLNAISWYVVGCLENKKNKCIQSIFLVYFWTYLQLIHDTSYRWSYNIMVGKKNYYVLYIQFYFLQRYIEKTSCVDICYCTRCHISLFFTLWNIKIQLLFLPTQWFTQIKQHVISNLPWWWRHLDILFNACIFFFTMGSDTI